MDHDVAYHRSFLPDGPFEPASCGGNCHGYSKPPGILNGKRLEDFEPHFVNKDRKRSPFMHDFPGMQQPPAKPALYYRTQKRRKVFQFIDGQLREIYVVERRDQNFSKYATEWEREWSVLTGEGKGRFDAVVDTGLLVIGHVGSVSGRRLWVPDKRASNNVIHLGAVLDREVPVFVANKAPAGWFVYFDLSPVPIYSVVTGVDGEVVSGAWTDSAPGAVAVDGPVDYVVTALGLGKLGLALAKGLLKSLSRKFTKRAAKKTFDGPTKELAEHAAAKRLAEEVSKAGYNPMTGMTPRHFKAFQEAANETQLIIAVRHTNPKSIRLIEAGCPGKPKSLEFVNTSPNTGIVMANTADDVAKVHKAGFFVVDKDGVAKRVVKVGDKEVVEQLAVPNKFWQMEKGQIVDPATKKPIVGDYDLMGVIDPKNTGQNIALVAKNGEKLTNFSHPNVERFAAAVNRRMDMPRVLHGAQDQYKGFRGGASVFHPDGKVVHLANEQAVKDYYEQVLKRQTAAGSYPKPSPGAPVTDEVARQRAKKQLVK